MKFSVSRYTLVSQMVTPCSTPAKDRLVAASTIGNESFSITISRAFRETRRTAI